MFGSAAFSKKKEAFTGSVDFAAEICAALAPFSGKYPYPLKNPATYAASNSVTPFPFQYTVCLSSLKGVPVFPSVDITDIRDLKKPMVIYFYCEKIDYKLFFIIGLFSICIGLGL